MQLEDKLALLSDLCSFSPDFPRLPTPEGLTADGWLGSWVHPTASRGSLTCHHQLREGPYRFDIRGQEQAGHRKDIELCWNLIKKVKLLYVIFMLSKTMK